MGVMDSSGLAVSFIQSLYHEFGSGVVLPDSGIVWQNRGASFSLDPRICWRWRRANSRFIPSTRRRAPERWPGDGLRIDGRRRPAANSGRHFHPLRSAGRPLQESISRPRWLLGRTWGQTSDSLKLEGRFRRRASPACGRWVTTWKCWPI
jgi:gamma-glutamyltranspeptidase/glutathione hydrolase